MFKIFLIFLLTFSIVIATKRPNLGPKLSINYKQTVLPPFVTKIIPTTKGNLQFKRKKFKFKNSK
jgi:hypothetical protein